MTTETTQPTPVRKGKRKFYLNIITMGFLLLGLIAVSLMKADFNLYLAFSSACLGGQAAFVWGNGNEYKYTANTQIEKTEPPKS